MRVRNYLSLLLSPFPERKWRSGRKTITQDSNFLQVQIMCTLSLFSPLLFIFLKKICWRGGRIKRRGSHYLFKNNPKELHNLLRGIWVHNDRETQISNWGILILVKLRLCPYDHVMLWLLQIITQNSHKMNMTQ